MRNFSVALLFAAVCLACGGSTPAPTPSATNSTISASTTSLQVGASTQVSVTVKDQGGAAMQGVAVAFAASGGGTSLSADRGTTDDKGVATFTLTATSAGAKTAIATFRSVQLSVAVTFTGTLYTAGVSAAPSPVPADGHSTTTITVTAIDGANHPASGLPVQLTVDGSNNLLVPPSGNTSADGIFVATLATSTAEVKKISAVVGALPAVTASATFVAPGTAPSATLSRIVAQPNAVNADGVSKSTITVTVFDAQGNPVAARAVSLSATGTGSPAVPVTLTPASGSTDASGNFFATVSATNAGTSTVTADLGASTTIGTTVQFVGNPYKATLSTSGGAISPNGSAAAPLSVLVTDSQGHAVSGIAVALAASPSTGTALIPATGTTDAAGVFTSSLASTVSGPKVVSAVVAGWATNTVSVNFLAGSASAATSTFSAAPNPVVADGLAKATLSLRVLDAGGVPVSGQAVTFSSDLAGDTFSAASASSDASGNATATLASTVAGSRRLSARVGALFTLTAQLTFVAGTPAQLIFSRQPASGVAGAPLPTVAVTVEDAHGNLVGAGVNAVALSISSGGFLLGTASQPTVSGVASFGDLSVTTAGTFKLTASAGSGIPDAPSASFTIAPGNAAASLSTLVIAPLPPTAVAADGASTATLTATALDALNNPVPNLAVTFATSGTGTFGAASVQTNGSGVAQTTLKSTVSGQQTVAAHIGSFYKTAPVLFSATGANATRTTFTVSPDVLVADGIQASALLVTVRDGNGNPVPGVTVSFASSDPADTLSLPSSQSAADGTATTNVSSLKAGTKTLTATVGTGGAAFSQTQTLLFSAGPAAALSFLTQPTDVLAGAANAAIRVAILDAHGNPTASTANVALSLGAGSPAGHLAGGAATAASKGVASFPAVAIDLAGSGYTLKATSGSLTPATSNSFLVAPGKADRLAFAQQPQSQTAGQALAPFTVQVQDASGNVVPSATQLISITAPDGTALSGTQAVAAVNGSAVFGSLTILAAGQHALSASASGLTSATSQSFTIAAGTPDLAHSSFTANPGSTLDDSASASTLTVTVQDSFGNPAPGITVGFSTTGGKLTRTSSSTGLDGIALVSLTSSIAGAATVTAAVGTAFSLSATVNFLSTRPDFANSSFTADAGGTAVADDATTIGLHLLVQDASGNPVVGASIALSSNGSGNTFTPRTGSTGADGRFDATIRSRRAELKTVIADVSGLISKSVQVSFTAGAPVALAFVQQPLSGASGTPLAPAVKLALVDTFGNFASAASANVSLALSGGTLAAALTGGGPNATTGGVATFANLQIDLVGTGFTLVASAGSGITPSTSAPFDIGPGTPAALSFLTQPQAGTAGVPLSTVKVQVTDLAGNPTLSDNTDRITVTVVDGATLTPSPLSAVAVAGVATFSGYAVTRAGAHQLKAAGTGLIPATSNSFTVSAAAASQAQSTFAVTGSPAVAGGAVTLAASILDPYLNPVSTDVTFTHAGAGTLTPATPVTTDASGNASAQLSSTVAATQAVGATAATLSFSDSATFSAGAVDATNTKLVASPTSAPADGKAAVGLTLTVQDSNQNPIPGAAITFASDAPATTAFTAVSGTTSASGVATASVTSTAVGSPTVTAAISVGGVLSPVAPSAQIAFTNGVPAKLAFVQQPSTASLGQAIAPAVTVVVEDAQGRPLTNATTLVSLSTSLDSPAGNLTGGAPVAAVNGVATFANLKVDHVGSGFKLVASATGLAIATSTPFDVGPGQAALLAFVAQPTDGIAGVGGSVVTVQVTDAAGNPTPTDNTDVVTLTVVDGATLSPSPLTATAVAGLATFTPFSLTAAGAHKLLASATGLGSATSTTFRTAAADPSQVASSFAVTGSPAVAGLAPITLAATILDQYLNPVSIGVAFTHAGAGTLSPGSTVATDASGVATAALTSTVAETQAVSATAGTVSFVAGFTATFTPDVPFAATSGLTALPASAPADGATPIALTLTVKDHNANVIPGVGVSYASDAPATTVLSSPTLQTDASGQSTVSVTGSAVSTPTITATLAGSAVAPSVKLSFTSTAGPADHVAFLVPPASTTVGQTLTPALQVAVQDAAGKLVDSSTASITVALSNAAALAGTATQSAVGGVATFADLSVTTAGTYTLTASAGSLTAATSASFSVAPGTLPGPATLVGGVEHFCSVVGGAVWCWGLNTEGELGQPGTLLLSAKPVLVPGLGALTVTAVAAGNFHTCALAGGAAYCWGFNDVGQLGGGTVDAKPTFAAPAAATAFVGSVQQIALGWEFTCAAIGGGVQCLGSEGNWGALGDGSRTGAQSTAVQTIPAGSGVVGLSARERNACALFVDGSVQCWGDNSTGQLGANATGAFSALPVVVKGFANIVKVSVGYGSICALDNKGAVSCLGDDSLTQLGDGKTVPSSTTPVLATLAGPASDLAAGDSHACALEASGIECWGNNGNGQVGTGTLSATAGPAAIALAGPFRSVASAGYSSCGVLAADGSLHCWGENTYGTLAEGHASLQQTPVLIALTGPSHSTGTLAMGRVQSCALGATGTISCWGGNQRGAVGANSAAASLPVPTPIADSIGGSAFAGLDKIFGRDDGFCANGTDPSGTGLYCWGKNDQGQLAQPDGLPRSKPSLIAGSGKWSAYWVGANTACAGDGVAATGASGVLCWGAGGKYQSGSGTTADAFGPVAAQLTSGSALTVDPSLQTMYAGPESFFIVGIDPLQPVLGFGANTDSLLLSDCSVSAQYPANLLLTGSCATPTPLTGAINGSAFASNRWANAACAQLPAGGGGFSWQCWGDFPFGTAGGTALTAPTDETALLPANLTSLKLGAQHYCFIDSSGKLFCGGFDYLGQLGSSTVSASGGAAAPVAVPLQGTTLYDFDVGANHTCATTEVGVQCWGSDSEGQLGDGYVQSVPAPVASNTAWPH